MEGGREGEEREGRREERKKRGGEKRNRGKEEEEKGMREKSTGGKGGDEEREGVRREGRVGERRVKKRRSGDDSLLHSLTHTVETSIPDFLNCRLCSYPDEYAQGSQMVAYIYKPVHII